MTEQPTTPGQNVYDHNLHTTRAHADAIDQRMRQLGDPRGPAARPGYDLYYGHGMPESYDAHAVEELGLMPDGTFQHPRIARAADEVDRARTELGNLEDMRDQGEPVHNDVCQARADLARAQRALTEAEATYDDAQFVADAQGQYAGHNRAHQEPESEPE
ncbi:hypothetical protein GCM10009772_15690 [Pseudonocardia alni subsp. carboxydivorans]|uniref:Excreted virulence factor EspC (Type VII ESX diderm) n=1 Tax=Pseudonocardia alni subsp. carboxydivorans TaxID=415010 RepID=A0ABU9AL43_PSEA5|nr:hypothetical protein [Pseudonocardia sp. ICBG1034]